MATCYEVILVADTATVSQKEHENPLLRFAVNSCAHWPCWPLAVCVVECTLVHTKVMILRNQLALSVVVGIVLLSLQFEKYGQ